jgi:hypothetical protein
MSLRRQMQNGIDVVRDSVATGIFSIMRLFIALSVACLCSAAARAELPGAAAAAIEAFRADGARGWAYTQTTVDEGRKTIERFDPGRPELVRWTLVEKDGGAPSAPELQQYRERKARRVLTAGPPPLKNQLDLDTAELLEETSTRWRYRFHLKPGAATTGRRSTCAPYSPSARPPPRSKHSPWRILSRFHRRFSSRSKTCAP